MIFHTLYGPAVTCAKVLPTAELYIIGRIKCVDYSSAL